IRPGASPAHLLAAILLTLFFPAAAMAQTDVIRGRITGADGAAVSGAVVTATSLNGNVTRTARTDKDGKYNISFPGDEGDYFINVAAVGYAAKRFEIKRTADQEVLVADAKLSATPTRLDAVNVTGQRQRPPRLDNSTDIGGNDRSINMGAVSADLMG